MIIFHRKIGGKLSEDYYVKFEFKNKQYLRSTGSSNLAAAKKNADLIYKAITNERFVDADRMKLRSDVATLGQVFDMYLDGHKTRWPQAKANIAGAKLIVRDVLGEKVDPRDQKLTILTREFGLKFQQKRLRECSGGFVEEGRAKITINSTMRKLKSLFARKLLDSGFYDPLNIPDVSEFMKVPKLKEPERKFKRISDAQLEAMNAAAEKLKDSHPELYLVHLLFLRLGLRNKEMLMARKDWITNHDGKCMLEIVVRDESRPKGSEGVVPVSDYVYEQICKHKDPEGFIIPAAHKTERYDLIYREHSKWVKQFIGGRQKTSYELRKHAGSMIARKHDVQTAQAFLRHQSYSTTMKSYVTLLEPLQPLMESDFAKSKGE